MNVPPLARSVAWLKAHTRELRFALRMMLSAGVAFVVAQALELSQPTWAVISAIVVARASAGDAFKSGRDRVIGTLTGAVVGVVLAFGRPLGVPELVLIAVGVGALAFAFTFHKAFAAAPIALVIVLASDPSGHEASVTTALHRLTEVGLGAAIAIGFAWLFRQWALWRGRRNPPASPPSSPPPQPS
ncbi:MAG TPA: FUSC family protein [Magnetospirillaceae bacterium]